MAASWYEANVSCADPECIWRGSAAGYDEDEVLASAGRLLQDHQWDAHSDGPELP